MDANVVYGPEADENKVNGPRESAEEGFSKAHGRSKNSDPKEDKKSQLSAEVAPHLVPPPPPVVSNDEMPDAYDSSYIDSLTVGSPYTCRLTLHSHVLYLFILIGRLHRHLRLTWWRLRTTP